MSAQLPDDVLQFWFPQSLNQNLSTLVNQWQQWFRGGADAEIIQNFVPLLEQARRGELDTWSSEARSRLALIIVLDQFSRTIYRGTAQAFAQDPKACKLTIEGIEVGHYAAITTPWEKTFFLLPLGHSEDLHNHDIVVRLTEALIQESPPEFRSLMEFSAEQARRNREVITRFGRHPHRNEILGRPSTPAELEYLAAGQLVHTRSFPPQLSQFLSNP